MYKRLDYFEDVTFPNLTEKAYYILEEAIITLELKPGQSYSEKELSSFINIGRTPVREAIKKLEQTRLVEIIPRSGVTILPIRLEEALLQMEVRGLLEKLIMLRATKFATPKEREHLLELATRYEDATEEKDAIKSIRIDDEFNVFIADCARNVYAAGALKPLQPSSRRIYFQRYYVDDNMTKNINYGHIKLMRAIASGSTDEVIKNLDTLFDYLKDLVLKTFNSIVLDKELLDSTLK